MARSARGRRFATRQLRPAPYPVPSYRWKAEQEVGWKKTSSPLEKRDWEDTNCSVCMEYPHNAVLLLCSSHDKGCRPYMCGTSHRHSNCLDQYKKAYSKVTSLQELATGGKSDGIELSCPLCRGQVKGWTVVESARRYLDGKKRTCMQDGCSFTGTYKELRKHVKCNHPFAKPREVDPALEQKWRTLEHERERQDVISTLRSSMPGAVVFGDYVIEMADSDDDSDLGFWNDRDYDEGAPDVSRSILYLFLREGARFMRFHRDSGAGSGSSTVGGDGSGSGSGLAAAYPSEGDDEVDAVLTRGQGVQAVERRRRRRRSRGRLFEGSTS